MCNPLHGSRVAAPRQSGGACARLVCIFRVPSMFFVSGTSLKIFLDIFKASVFLCSRLDVGVKLFAEKRASGP